MRPLMAGIELGRRVSEFATGEQQPSIGSTADAIRFCQQRFSRLIADAKHEEFHIVTLDTKNQVIDSHRITVGTLDASLVHPREVFRAAIRDAAKSIILVHNHPSGDATPSREDFQVTNRLEEVGTTIGISVLDHIVLGNPTCVSIREAR
jgi:DNA repair protein RadC